MKKLPKNSLTIAADPRSVMISLATVFEAIENPRNFFKIFQLGNSQIEIWFCGCWRFVVEGELKRERCSGL